MRLLNFLNRTIKYCFYAMFLLVPFVFTSDTSELFEFNKLWLTFGLTIIIAIAWFSKMVIERQIKIQKTPLDIPILLFLGSQILSTIFSIDKHVSLWGYYSRFNGGLYSIITYIFLYYAFVSNLSTLKFVKKIIKLSLISGAIVALWGLPSHFGYDPTCLLFRGTLDVSCWTDDFQPKLRIFSTMGQPDWMAAYLTILLPISIVMFFDSLKFEVNKLKKLILSRKNLLSAIAYLLLTILFYADLMYTSSRSGVIAGWIVILAILALYFIHRRKDKAPEAKIVKFVSLGFLILFIVTTFLTSIPFGKLQPYTLPNIVKNMNQPQSKDVKKETPEPTPAPHLGALGGTDSTKIRFIVWKGALGVWKSNPLFGSGVETFAYSYYNHRPASHNLTSEWNFLYNKAHNEFLNYLATTGIIGLGTYLYLIYVFLSLYYKAIKKLHREKQKVSFLTTSLVASFTAILVTNFFGFSVVITNIYFFIIPALVLTMLELINKQKVLIFFKKDQAGEELSTPQKISIVVIAALGIYLITILFVFWKADRNYAYGMNLDQAQHFQEARPYLIKAVEQRSGEPTFRGEYAVNTAVLATLFANQKDTSGSAQITQNLAQESSFVVEGLTESYPKNVVYWKTKVKVYYYLSQIDSRYLTLALEAIKKTAELAPTDANIVYNYAVITGQTGDVKKAIELLEKTIKLKVNYIDAYYALGIFYEELASNEKGQVISEEYHQKAIDQLKFILENLSPDNTRVKDTLTSWEKK